MEQIELAAVHGALGEAYCRGENSSVWDETITLVGWVSERTLIDD